MASKICQHKGAVYREPDYDRGDARTYYKKEKIIDLDAENWIREKLTLMQKGRPVCGMRHRGGSRSVVNVDWHRLDSLRFKHYDNTASALRISAAKVKIKPKPVLIVAWECWKDGELKRVLTPQELNLIRKANMMDVFLQKYKVLAKVSAERRAS